ncbi:MAG TPA: nuclear transport factor 2 family protein [Acetobacteraceae bacterium]|jgi:ketosteroid isomerase-like protein|nr:nuclear transport factor 2 family protein [Acetobacteraceae bacterium]
MLEDKDAIRELLHRYCFHMDEGRFVELAALFADDGAWIAPYRTANGPAEIAAWLQKSVPSQPKRMHFVMNSIIDVAGTCAAARSNYLVMVEGSSGPIPSVCGTYADDLVKLPDGWRFQRRELIHAFKGEMALTLR